MSYIKHLSGGSSGSSSSNSGGSGGNSGTHHEHSSNSNNSNHPTSSSPSSYAAATPMYFSSSHSGSVILSSPRMQQTSTSNSNLPTSPIRSSSTSSIETSPPPPPPPPLTPSSSSSNLQQIDHSTSPTPAPSAATTYASSFGSLSSRLPRALDGNTRFIRLNVGGSEFITTTETLCKEESMLSAMVRHHQSKLPNETGDVSKQEPLFIDRDGTHFLEILNYLRNGALDPLPETEEHWRALLREADFYGITSLIEILKVNCTKPKYKFYVLIKGNSFYNCQVYPPPKSYEKRHSNPCNMVSCLNAHLRDGFDTEDIVWPTITSDACQAILYKWMVD